MNLEEVAKLDLTPEILARPLPTDLRVGLVGAGRVVQNSVLPAYQAGGFMPVAAADPDPEARAAVSTRWGVPRVFADYREMLDEVELDVVDLNIMWNDGLSETRLAVVRSAAERGLHVIMAKPLADTWENCLAIVEAARSSGIKLAVDQDKRYAPAYHGCGVLIRSGAVGKLISASYHYYSAVGRQHTNWFDGAHDNAVHAIDVLRTWFQAEPTEVFAHWSRRVDGIGSVYTATLMFDSGANATILFDFATRHRRQMEFVAVGETASVDGRQDVDLPGPARLRHASLRYAPHQTRALTLELPLTYAASPTTFLASRADFFEAITRDREPAVSGEDNLNTMRVLFALERSIRERQVVRLATQP